MAHPPAKTIWELGSQLKFDEPLEADDERFVDTRSARGDFGFDPLLRPYGVDTKTDRIKFEPNGVYSLFCGHRGCGKSTELRRLRHRLNRPELFFVVFLDVLKELDINNLSYADVLLATAKELITRIGEAGIDIDRVHLRNLENWFAERIERHETTKDLAAEFKAGLKGEQGIPFLAKLFAQLTSSVTVGSIHKEELRKVIGNSFTQFAQAFQQLIDAADDKVKDNGKGRCVLFIIDGTDRLRGEDSDNFFIRNAYQLRQLRGNFIYGAPIHLIYEKNQLGQVFENIPKLPMIKIEEKGSDALYPEGVSAMKEIVYKRADRSLFDSEETADYLIKYSGGNPRDLLHLLMYAFKLTDTEQIDRRSAEAAVKELATDYRRTLNKDDYRFLCEVDSAPDDTHDRDKAEGLLYSLALLEYNSYWWRSHPVVRTLPGYIECMSGKRQEDETS
ncbi:MAG: AAA family ATPase [Syntrophobacteraceae bacterium]|nr:AAA family ATPase [Syntrophobacteraceae bacterium]